MGQIIKFNTQEEWKEAGVEPSVTRFLKKLFVDLDDRYDPKSPINLINILYNMGVEVVGMESTDRTEIARLEMREEPRRLLIDTMAVEKDNNIIFEVMAACVKYIYDCKKFIDANYSKPTPELLDMYREIVSEAADDLPIPRYANYVNKKGVAKKKRLSLSDKKLYRKYLVDKEVQTLHTEEGFENYKKTLISDLIFREGFPDYVIENMDGKIRDDAIFAKALASRDAEYEKDPSKIKSFHEFE